MRKIGRIFFSIICLCLLFRTADFIPAAQAASAMTASESCVEFIKSVEGFSAQPYYDYSQHTVGYGTKCPTDKYFDYMANGITKEEAEILLRETLIDIENAINQKLMDAYQLTFSQNQFDALVSFSFNLGTGWMTYDSTLRNALLTNADSNELVYAFSLYSTAGGQYLTSLISRRLCEANIYLNGVYSKTADSAYGYVLYEPNGGSLTYRVQGYICDYSPAPVADALRNGDVFLGWYTDITGGSKVDKLDRSLSGKTLFAQWQSGENSDEQDASSTVIKVTGDVVNIRKGPGTNYGIAKQVYRDDILIVSTVTYLTNMTWGKVQDGWICLDYTSYNAVINGDDHSGSTESQPDSSEDIPEWNESDTQINTTPGNQNIIQGTVSVNDLLRIRNGPGTNYSTVGYLFNGNKVEIFEQKTVGSMNWGRISQGWVSMNYIVTDIPDVAIPTEPDLEYNQQEQPEQSYPMQEHPEQNYENTVETDAVKGIITADALRIRAGAGTEYAIVGFYYQNDIVTISQFVLVDSTYWGKTAHGWINMNYVDAESSNQEPSQPSVTGVKTVIADCLRVRKEIGTDSKIAALLYYGDTVTVLDTTIVDGVVWGKVANGWICMDYVI